VSLTRLERRNRGVRVAIVVSASRRAIGRERNGAYVKRAGVMALVKRVTKRSTTA